MEGTFSSEHLSCSTNALSTVTQDLRSVAVRGRVKAFSPARAGHCKDLVDAIIRVVFELGYFGRCCAQRYICLLYTPEYVQYPLAKESCFVLLPYVWVYLEEKLAEDQSSRESEKIK